MAVALLVAASLPQPAALHSGGYGDWLALRGWYSPERLPDGTLFRWSGADATVALAIPADRAPRLVTVALAAGRPGAAPLAVALTAGASAVTLPVAPTLRRFHLVARPAAAQRPLLLTLHAPTFQPNGRADALGVQLVAVQAAPLGRAISWWLVGWSLLVLALLGASGALLGGPALPTSLLVGGALVVALVAQRRAEVGRWLPWLALLLALAVVLGAAVRRRWGAPALQRWALLAGITLGGLSLRAFHLNWDDGAGFHVDEAVFNQAALALTPPYHPHFFAYGSLPLYLYRLTAAALGWLPVNWLDLRVFPIIGRSYAVLSSAATVVVTALIGRRLGGWPLGWLAALLVAGSALAIQQAHYGTTDSLVALLAALQLWLALDIAQHDRRRAWVLSGVVLGLGAATKIPALVNGVFPALALLARALDPAARRWPALRHTATSMALAALAGLAACAVTAPYYFLDAAGLWAQMRLEFGDATTGTAVYTRQFIGTRPYWFVVQNWPWTLGWPLTVAALLGFAALLALVARGWRTAAGRQWLVLVGGALGYFLFFGRFHDKYIRYTLPLVPPLALAAAHALLLPARWPAGRALSAALIVVVAGWTGIYGLAFTDGVYGQPDPRLQASHWLQTHVPSGTTISREQFDVYFPIYPTTDRPLGSPPWFRTESLQWYEDDSPGKVQRIAAQLARSDYQIVASRSVYRPSLDHPELFAANARFYRALFAGAAGWREVARWQPYPQLGPWRWPAPAPEETFEVFDHPTVLVYARDPAFDPLALERLLWPATP